MATQNWDWVFHALGWTLAALGLLLAHWALFYDRSRGRRRCPKCWYSMEGAIAAEDGAVKCPECGKEISTPRKLTKTRRRKRWTALAIVLVLGSHFVWATPRIQSEGWSGAVPTTLIIVSFQWLAPQEGSYLEERPEPIAFYFQRTTLVESFAQSRVEDNTLWSWQRLWLESKVIRHMHANFTGFPWAWTTVSFALFDDREPHTPELKRLWLESVQFAIDTRDAWPAQMPFKIYFSLMPTDIDYWHFRISVDPHDPRIEPFVIVSEALGPSYLEDPVTGEERPGKLDGYLLVLPPLPRKLEEIRCDIVIEGKRDDEDDWDFLRTVPYTIAVRTTDSAHDIMAPANDKASQALIVNSEPPKLYLDHEGQMRIQWEPNLRELRGSDTAIGVHLRVFGDDQLLYTSQRWWVDEEYDDWVLLLPRRDYDQLKPVSQDQSVDPLQVKHWAVELVGDPVVALCDFKREKYWAAELVLDATFGDFQRPKYQDFKPGQEAATEPEAKAKPNP